MDLCCTYDEKCTKYETSCTGEWISGDCWDYDVYD